MKNVLLRGPYFPVYLSLLFLLLPTTYFHILVDLSTCRNFSNDLSLVSAFCRSAPFTWTVMHTLRALLHCHLAGVTLGSKAPLSGEPNVVNHDPFHHRMHCHTQCMKSCVCMCLHRCCFLHDASSSSFPAVLLLRWSYYGFVWLGLHMFGWSPGRVLLLLPLTNIPHVCPWVLWSPVWPHHRLHFFSSTCLSFSKYRHDDHVRNQLNTPPQQPHTGPFSSREVHTHDTSH